MNRVPFAPADPASQPALRWSANDFEQRWFGHGAPYTQVNGVSSAIIALILTVATYLFLGLVVTPLTTELPPAAPTESASPNDPGASPAQAPTRSPVKAWIRWFNDMLTLRGPTQHVTVFCFWWSATILIFKSGKLRAQESALADECVPVPADPAFVLTGSTVDQVIHRLKDIADDPRHFLVFNRMLIALSNLKNLGRVSDVDDILRAQAENDESQIETSYSIVSGLVWAIPVLGFIGTVLGLSEAISKFGDILRTSTEMENIKAGLKGVTDGLSTAFETTLLALVAALLVQMWLVILKKREQEFLDKCSEYCLRHVVNRLRISHYEDERA